MNAKNGTGSGGTFSRLGIITLILLAINILAVFVPNHRVRVAGLRIPAETVYKPTLFLNGAFVLYLLLARRPILDGAGRSRAVAALGRVSGRQFAVTLVIVGATVYVPALGVNFQHHDWTHRHISSGLASLPDFGRFFVTPQVDGMYRPLTFLSLWVDYRLFGSQLWAYHLQSIVLHVVNAALVGALAVQLGMRPPAGRLAALLFAVAAIHFEAVVWPAARFDLLAAAFTCLSIILFLKFWRAQGIRIGYAALSLLSFVIAALNKETAYSAVLIVAGLIATRKLWRLDAAGRSKGRAFLGILIACAGLLLTARFLLYGGIGGYSDAQGRSIHAAVSAKSVYLLVVNTLSLSPFAINASAPPSVWTYAIVLGFGCLVVAIAAFSGSGDRRRWGLVLLALLSAVPVLNVVGWIQPTLLHTRHLYWPSVWTMLLVALCMHRRCPLAVMIAYLLLQAGALTYNISAQRNVLRTAASLARYVGEDVGPAQSARSTIHLLGVPESLDGVLYFGSELETRIQQSAPGATLRFYPATTGLPLEEAAPHVTYRWDASTRTLMRLQ